jgi:hypothetical protein
MNKECARCGVTALSGHYHDIITNKRYCLPCTRLMPSMYD